MVAKMVYKMDNKDILRIASLYLVILLKEMMTYVAETTIGQVIAKTNVL